MLALVIGTNLTITMRYFDIGHETCNTCQWMKEHVMYKLSITTAILVFSLGLTACSQLNPTDTGELIFPTVGPDKPLDTQFPLPGDLPVALQTPTIEALAPVQPTQTVESPVIPQINVERSVSSLETPVYRVQAGSPVAMANFIQPEAGCNFMGVGGQPFDLSGQPVVQLVVEVGGSLAGSDVFHLQLSGNAPVLGPGGFHVVLSDHPIESNGTLWILLYDLAGQPLTEKIYFSTYNDCSRNFTLINFVQVDPSSDYRINFPIIYR